MSRIVTFYSYKGGVGRTFALANIAVLLAKMGKRVLVMDWDLEAPGLHRYFEKYQNLSDDQHQGLIHLLCEVKKNPKATWRSYITKVRMPDGEQIDLLPSGDQAPDYVDRVGSFSWNAFFSDGGGGSLLDQWRTEWKSHYDFVLVDSRTGITDAGGVCTIYLPDILVLAFTANEQSFSRGIQVVTGAQKARRDLSVPRAPLAVLPLPGKFDGRDEVDDAQMWMARFAKDLKPFYEDWLPKDMNPRKILELTKIPYITKFSFGEPLPVVTQGTTDPEFPGFYLQNVADLLESDFRDARQIIDPDSSDRYTKLLRSAFSSDGTLDDASIERLIEQVKSENGNSFEAAEALSEAATLLSRRQRYSDAEVFFLHAIDIYHDLLGSEHPELNSTTRRLAGMYREMGRLDDALQLYERSLEQSEMRGRFDDPAMLATYNNIAGIYREMGRLDEALQLYERSLEQSEMRGRRDNPAMSATYNNIAGIHREMGRFDEALHWYERSLEQSEMRGRRDDPAMLTTYNNIAGIHREMGRFDEALHWYKRSLEQSEMRGRRDDPAMLVTYINIAGIHREMGRFDEALHWYERSLEQSEMRGRRDDPAMLTTYNNIAGIHREMGRLDVTLEWYRRALQVAEEQSHPNSVVRRQNAQQSVLLAQNNIAKTYHEMGRLDDAIEWYERPLKQQDFRRSYIFVFQMMRVAGVLLEKGDRKRAEEILVDAFRMTLEGPWPKNYIFPDKVKKDLAMLLEAVGREEESFELSRDLQFDVFMLYNHKDSKFVRDLAHRIESKGVKVWFDQWNLQPGSKVQEAISDTLGTVPSILYCVGRSTSPEPKSYLEDFLDREHEKSTLIIPVLLPDADLDRMPAVLHNFRFIDLQDGISEIGVDRIVTEIKWKNESADNLKKDGTPRQRTQH